MKRVFLGLLLFVMLFIVSACTGKDTDRETEQLTEDTSTSFESDTAMPIEDDSEETENQETEMIDIGIFDFKTKKVMLNSGYEMPIMGLGAYALDYDTCVSSVKALLQNGGRLIDTAYMYGNEDAVGEGVRQAMEEYGIPREDIFVITKIYPSQFDDPEAAIDMALDKMDIGYIDMMLLHHP